MSLATSHAMISHCNWARAKIPREAQTQVRDLLAKPLDLLQMHQTQLTQSVPTLLV